MHEFATELYQLFASGQATEALSRHGDLHTLHDERETGNGKRRIFKGTGSRTRYTVGSFPIENPMLLPHAIASDRDSAGRQRGFIGDVRR